MVLFNDERKSDIKSLVESLRLVKVNRVIIKDGSGVETVTRYRNKCMINHELRWYHGKNSSFSS